MKKRQRRKARPPHKPAAEGLLALHRIALDSAAQDICVYDADNRVVLFNRRFVELFNLSADVVRAGLTYRELMDHSAACGNFPPERVESICRERFALVAAGKPFSAQQEIPNGILMTLDIRPLADGSWITVCDDITRRAKLETALQVQTDRIERAVAHMSHGLTLFGADERLILCNEQYLRIYRLDPDVIKPGITLRELIAHFVAQGHAPEQSAEELYLRRRREIARGESSVGIMTCGDGRTIQAISSP